MPSCDPRVMACGFGAFLLTVGVALGSAQAPRPAPAADGLLRSELSLVGRTATVAYSSLRADDPAHRDLLSAAPGSAGVPVRVGRLVTTGPLRIGTEEIGKPAAKPDPGGIRYDLWLTGTNEGWQLQVSDVAAETEVPEPPGVPGLIVAQTLLARKTTTTLRADVRGRPDPGTRRYGATGAAMGDL